MHILVTFPDGTRETLECRVGDQALDRGGLPSPGLLVAEPSDDCPARSDWFMAALTEGNLVQGLYTECSGEEDEAAFRWALEPSTIRTEDGFTFHFQPQGAFWSDAPDPDDADMTVDARQDGSPDFDSPLAYVRADPVGADTGIPRLQRLTATQADSWRRLSDAARGRLLQEVREALHGRLADEGLLDAVSVRLALPWFAGRCLELDEIVAHRQGAGAGSRALALLAEIVTERGVSLVLRLPTGEEPGSPGAVDRERLVAWYGRAGFSETDRTDVMIRPVDPPTVTRFFQPSEPEPGF